MCEYKNDMTVRQYKRKHLDFPSNIGVHAWTELFSLESTYVFPPEFAERQNRFLSRIKHIMFECVFGRWRKWRQIKITMVAEACDEGRWAEGRESAGGEETVELKI